MRRLIPDPGPTTVPDQVKQLLMGTATFRTEPFSQ